MTAGARFVSKRLLTVLQQTWAERDAFRTKLDIEASGHTANWEEILQAAQTRARELFQPALSSLDDGRPLVEVFEEIAARLEAAQQSASSFG
jgi:Flp pilus assembly CpaE family ATPase